MSGGEKAGLAAWGAREVEFSVTVENVVTGESEVVLFRAPVGSAAVSLRDKLQALGESATLAQRTAVMLGACVPSLAGEPTDVLERILIVTGGLESPLVAGVDRCVRGRGVDDDVGWGRSADPT